MAMAVMVSCGFIHFHIFAQMDTDAIKGSLHDSKQMHA